ncbi:hypothetical protein HHI36_022068 [Cryptolaemus montrouzieri]|uniref:Uncharacterized protein n=1 Tax=Cryptolaemus montrouzieri TaxID=559131 RepID=A0ABD2MYL4_9CUCU
MKVLLNLSLICSIFLCSSTSKLPKDLQQCSQTDIACLKSAIQDALPKLKDGIPDLGVPPLDPLRISKMTIGSGKIVQLVQNYENVDITGLSEATVNDLSFDLDKGKLVMSLSAPLIVVKGVYTVKGKILVLDVYGTGDCSIKLHKLTGTFSMDLETYSKNNEMHIKGTNAKFVFDTEHGEYNFENLFDGNKQLGDNINAVLNDNWREIFLELREGYGAVVAEATANLSNKLFESTSIQNMFN